MSALGKRRRKVKRIERDYLKGLLGVRPNREDFFVGFPVSVSFSCFTPVRLTRRQPASCPKEFERLLLLLLSGQQRCIRQTYWSAFCPAEPSGQLNKMGILPGNHFFVSSVNGWCVGWSCVD